MATSKISPSPMSISFDENNEPTVHYDDGTSEKISSVVKPSRNNGVNDLLIKQNSDLGIIEKSLAVSVNSDSDFPLICTIYKILKEKFNDDFVYLFDASMCLEKVMFKKIYSSGYNFGIYPNNLTKMIDIEECPVSMMTFYMDFPKKINHDIDGCEKMFTNKFMVFSEITVEHLQTKTTKTLNVNSYVYRVMKEIAEDVITLVFVSKSDIQKVYDFYNSFVQDMDNITSILPYSVDVFPEEAMSMIQKIENMVSDQNFKKLNDYNYPCQFGLVIVGEPGVGKTMFVKHLNNSLLASDKIKSSKRDHPFKEIHAYNVGDIHRLCSMGRDLPLRGIVLLDDLDSAIKNRDIHDGQEGRAILPWLLTQLDRFSDNNEKIRRIIVMCSNQLSYVDAALIRPGRLDKIITFPSPNETSIRNMIHYVMKNDETVTTQKEQEIFELYKSKSSEISLANISLMGRLVYGGLIETWEEAVVWSLDRGYEINNVILKEKNNKVGFAFDL